MRRHRRRDGLQCGAARDDDGGQSHQGQDEPADQRRGARQAEEVDEHREAEQPEDDRGHRGEVVDVHLDEVRQPVGRCEFLEIDGGRDADGERQHEGDQQGVERADRGAPDPRELRLARVAGGEERGVEALLDAPGLFERRHPPELIVLDAPFRSRRGAIDVALDEHVHVVVGRDPDALGPADEPGVCEHAFAKDEARAGAHDAVQGALGLASLHVREQVPHRLLDQSGIVRGRQRL